MAFEIFEVRTNSLARSLHEGATSINHPFKPNDPRNEEEKSGE
jgi:hypothetical protein